MVYGDIGTSPLYAIKECFHGLHAITPSETNILGVLSLVIVCVCGLAVGMGKVSRVSKDQWWLEGLRVDPRYQGLKIGTQLHVYLQDWWEQHGGGIMRLMTSWERVEVHHMCERFGWTKVGEVKEHMAPALPEETHTLRPVPQSELDEALRFALSHLEHHFSLRSAECMPHGMAHKLMDGFLVRKSDFSLGRMNVHVDSLGVDVEEQHERRVMPFREKRSIPVGHRMKHRRVSDRPPIDEQVLGNT